MKLKKFNKTRAFSGEVNFKVEMDNSYEISAKVFKKQGGEYRLLPYKVDPTSFCDFFNSDDIAYPELVKLSDFEKPLICPMKAVNFQNLIFHTR